MNTATALAALTAFAAAGLSISCTNVPGQEPPFEATRVKAPADRLAVDQVVVLFDASGSIDPQSEFPYEKARLESFVSGMPDGDYEVDLVSFGGRSREETGLAGFDRDTLARAAADTPYLGEDTPLEAVLRDTAERLAGRSGTAAVVIVTDGVPTVLGTEVDPEPTLEAARAVVESHDGTVCFHTVHAGSETSGRELLQQISEITDCGSHRTSDSIGSAAPLYAFQQEIFVGEAIVDVAAPAPVGVADADGDGVPDGLDQCAETPAGAETDAQGCWRLSHVPFASDSAAVPAEIAPQLASVAGVMRANPDLRLRIEGHSDATGSAAYNQALSERRAEAVRQSLVDAGVEPDRLEVSGLGESQPIAGNDSAAGRAENRRIELKVLR
jgi:OOP family OmpA-OmpF porin